MNLNYKISLEMYENDIKKLSPSDKKIFINSYFQIINRLNYAMAWIVLTLGAMVIPYSAFLFVVGGDFYLSNIDIFAQTMGIFVICLGLCSWIVTNFYIKLNRKDLDDLMSILLKIN